MYINPNPSILLEFKLVYIDRPPLAFGHVCSSIIIAM